MDKKIISTIFLTFNLSLAFTQENLVIPTPKELSYNNSRFIVNTDFSISVTAQSATRIYDAAARLLTRLKGRTGLFISQYRAFSDYPEATMFIIVDKPGKNVLYEDESGKAIFEYDLPSSRFGQFGDERITQVGRELDAELAKGQFGGQGSGARGQAAGCLRPTCPTTQTCVTL